MAFEKLQKLSKEIQAEIEMKCGLREKFIILSIAEALKVSKKTLEKLKYEPDQICGLCIANIHILQVQKDRLEKRNKQLVKEKETRGQQVLDFIKKFDGGGNSI